MATKKAPVTEHTSANARAAKRPREGYYDLHYSDYTLQATLYKDKPLVHLRRRVNDKFVKDGIALTESEWEGFQSLWPTIDNEISSGCQQGERLWTVGERHRTVSVKRFINKGVVSIYVDIRHRWDPLGDGNLHYTRQGCCLDVTGFKVLKKCAPLIREDLTNLQKEADSKQYARSENMRMIDERLKRLARPSTSGDGTSETPPLSMWYDDEDEE